LYLFFFFNVITHTPEGCNTAVNGEYCKIHYWLAMAEGEDDYDRPSKPLVLWLNGGPGSSSILGLVQELGPYLVNATGGFMVNPYAWTKLAHVVVLESPVGVGYSYCAAQKSTKNGGSGGGYCRNTDKFTASANRAALVDLFVKFPEFQSVDFFITGESYAGVYIPTLADEILRYNNNNVAQQPQQQQKVVIPLRGIAVGDPCTSNREQDASMDALWYGHKYGLVDDDVFDTLWNKCRVRVPNGFSRRPSTSRGSPNRRPEDGVLRAIHAQLAARDEENDQNQGECTLAFRKFLVSTSRGLSQDWDNGFIDDYSLFAPISNDEDAAMAQYMNRIDVQTALHIDMTLGRSWPNPAGYFDYTKEFDACNWDDDSITDPRSMIDFYRTIAPQLNVTWVYNGDTDPCVSYEGTRRAIKAVGFPEVDGGGYRPWFFDDSATTVSVLAEKAVLFGPDLLLRDAGPQFGGEIVNYQHNLAFLTVHGSGHMVPQFRPQAALHMLDRFIHYQPLTPLLPRNETILAMTDEEFDAAMDEWTAFAKTMPTMMTTDEAIFRAASRRQTVTPA
jgi:serine carboxypeptidase-like clade I